MKQGRCVCVCVHVKANIMGCPVFSMFPYRFSIERNGLRSLRSERARAIQYYCCSPPLPSSFSLSLSSAAVAVDMTGCVYVFVIFGVCTWPKLLFLSLPPFLLLCHVCWLFVHDDAVRTHGDGILFFFSAPFLTFVGECVERVLSCNTTTQFPLTDKRRCVDFFHHYGGTGN